MAEANLNPLDWILIALLAYSTIRAFLRGLILETFSLVGLFAGILLASWRYRQFGGMLSRWITPMVTADIVAWIVIAVGVMILCGLTARVLRLGANGIGLGFFDRLGGAAFGLIRGCLLGVAILMLATAFFPASGWIVNSRLAPYFLRGAHRVSFVVPHELREQLSFRAMQLKHSSTDWIKPLE